LANCKVTPQTIWHIAKYCSERGGPKAPSAIHGPFGSIFYPIDIANIYAEYFENQFTVHDLCDCYNRRHVDAKTEALLTAVNEDTALGSDPAISNNLKNFFSLNRLTFT
jgi:hypothetical protein